MQGQDYLAVLCNFDLVVLRVNLVIPVQDIVITEASIDIAINMIYIDNNIDCLDIKISASAGRQWEGRSTYVPDSLGDG